MKDLNLTFDTETLFGLTAKQFKELFSLGETLTDFAPAKDYYIDKEFSRIFLSFDKSISYYHFEFDPVSDINNFIDNSYLTYFFPVTGQIKLIKDLEKPLSSLLPITALENTSTPIIGRENFEADIRDCKIFTDDLIDTASETLKQTGNFKGQFSCCECGEPGCSSEYLWAENNFGLISFHIFAAGLTTVKLNPFKIV